MEESWIEKRKRELSGGVQSGVKPVTQPSVTDVNWIEKRKQELSGSSSVTSAASKPKLPTSLPSPGEMLKKDTTTFKPAVKPNTVNAEATRLQKIADANKAAGKRSTAGMSKADYVSYAKLKQIEEKQRNDAREKGPVEKAGQFLGQFYTPGGGLSAISAGTKAVGNIVSSVAPKVGLGASTGAKVAREAIKEGVVGAIEGAGHSLAQNPEGGFKEAGKQALYGAGLGAGVGAASPVLGKGAQAIINKYRKPVTTSTTTPVQPTLVSAQELTGVTRKEPAQPDISSEPKIIQSGKQSQTGLDEAGGKMASGMVDSMYDALWSKVVKGDTTENGQQSALLQVAKVVKENGGLKSREDFISLAKDVTAARSLGFTGQEYQNELRKVVSKHITGSPLTGAKQVPTNQIPQSMGVPKRTTQKERSFNRTLRESENIGEEVAQGLEQSANRYYEPITNVGTVNKANKKLDRVGIDKAEAELLGRKKFTADDVVIGQRLIQQLQDTGEIQRAVTIADKVSEQLTKAGQTIQAASILNRLSPEGVLLMAQRKVRNINENLLRGQKEVKITPEQGQKITDVAKVMQASGASQERAQQVMEIMNREMSGVPISAEERKFVADFIKDAKSFLRKTDETKPPVDAVNPPEIKNPVIRKRVISYLDSAEQAARDRIRARGNQLSSTPLDIWADYAIIGASKMVKGALKYSIWSESMVRDFGEAVRPQLRQIYEKSKETLKAETLRISQQRITSAEKIATNWLNRNEARLLPEDITTIQTLAQDVSNLSGTEQRLASQDLQAIVQSFEKAGIGQKFSATQYIMMLLNPLTQIRNVVGNELMYRLERVQRVISTPIDIATAKLTGGKRTVTFKRGPSVFEDYFQPTKDFVGHLREGFSAGWRGVNPEGLQSKYELIGQAFTSKYNPLMYMEKSLGAVMQGFDYAAYKRATNGRLAETAYLDALNRGITGDEAIKSHMMTIMANMDDQIHTIASDYGKFATLQNESALATGLTTGRRIVNKLSTLGHSEHYGVGSVILPFAKTPANLLMRSIDYSPLGVLKAMNQTYSILRDPLTDLTRADVIESVSRATIGTGIGALAYWLADKGAIWGKSDKDPEVRKLMTASGQTDFQMNGTAIKRMIEAGLTGGDVDAAAKKQPGDTFWAYSWAAPTATPIAIGASVYKGIKDEDSGANIAATAALSAANTLLDSSVLSSLTEVFKQQPGQDNPFGSILMNLAKQVPGQFVPSLARQINSLNDPTVKETYAMKDDLLGQITNYAESSTPGLSQQLPQRVSTLGKPQERLNTFGDIFLSPAARSKYNPTREAQMVIDLIEETGDNKIAPRAVAKYIEGVNLTTREKERVDLTPEQYVRLQTFVGQETEKMLKRVKEGWTTEQKVEFIIDGLNYAGTKGRDMMKKEFGLGVSR